MNLFAEILAELAGPDLGTYREWSRQMPLFLLARAREANPHLAAWRPRHERIREHLAAHNAGREIWRDSEIYYPLVTLIEAVDDAGKTDELVRREEILLGLRDVREIADLPDGFVRLSRSHGEIFRVRGGSASRVEDPIATWLLPHRLLVYLPADELFNDLRPVEHYPRLTGDPRPAELLRRLERALDLLRALEPEVMQDFADLVGTIVLVPPLPQAPGRPEKLRWSYNLRFRYFGGLFLDLSCVEELGAAEGLLHEYFHQRLWQWFALGEPDGIPPADARIVSPITGNEREARVMVHALVIYAAALELYRRAADALELGAASARWVESRSSLLARGIPLLHRELGRFVPPETAVGRALAVVMSRSEAGGHCRRAGRAAAPEPAFTERTEMVETPKGCGILLHQRPLLQNIVSADDPNGFYFFTSWVATPDEEITDQGLAEATYTIDGMNLLFLKALVDGKPEIINIELPAGEFLTAERLLGSPKTICVHLGNDAASGFTCREAAAVEFLAPLRHLRILSHADPTRVATQALGARGGPQAIRT